MRSTAAQSTHPQRPYALVIDDDPGILDVYDMTLSDMGFQPILVSDGFQALQKALAYQPVLVIIDQLMPGITGTELIRQMRATGLNEAAIVVVSAGRNFESAAHGAGANASLEKPFDVEDLIKTVEKLVPISEVLTA